MSSLNDLFVSYKVIDLPKISVPTYTPDVAAATIILLQDMATKVDNVKARMSESPVFTYTNSGTKETPYSQPNTSNLEISLSNSSSVNISAREFIKKEEGFRSSRYKDAGGYSIGYGFYGNTYWKGNYITKDLADLVLDRILSELELFFSKFPVWNKLTNNLKTALHSYMYNVGKGHFSRDSKMGKALASGNLVDIHNAISINTSQGRRHEGLVRRRERERQLFNS